MSEDLGIYSRDLRKDEKINKKLSEFLKKQVIKLGKIKFIEFNYLTHRKT